MTEKKDKSKEELNKLLKKRGVPIKVIIIILSIPIIYALIIYYLSYQTYQDVTPRPVTAMPRYVTYQKEDTHGIVKHIGGKLDPKWGKYKQPTIPWYEKIFCKGSERAKNSWICPQKDRHPFISSRKYYGIKTKKRKKKEKFTRIIVK